jgi:hypothetical protein
MKYWKISLILFLLLAAGVLASCRGASSAPTQTPTMNVTQALETVEMRLTQAVALTPSPATPTLAAPAATPTVSGISPTPLTASVTGTPPAAAACNKVAPGNPIDVTVDDDTPMQPDQKFTKTWRLVNDGTCTWDRQYSAVWFFGDKFGDILSVPLSASVPPTGVIEVSVDMIAPSEPGSYRSNWKLADASGTLFGIGPNGDLPFWVQIVVVDNGGVTPTPTITLTPLVTTTPTPTQTPTQAVKTSGAANLIPGDRIDLDTNKVNPASGDDLSYEIDAGSSNHWLVGQNSGVLGLFGMAEPTLAVCKIATMSNAPIAVESLTPGTYLCFETDQGSYGWLRYDAYNSDHSSININFFTWGGP